MASMTTRARIFVALVAAATLLFSQLAISAYACPMDAAPVEAADDCHELVTNASLCQGHCDYGSASFEIAKPIQAPAAALVSFLRVEPADVHGSRAPAPSRHAASGPARPPPLSRFTVLRI
jgi:hypothetical protein